MNTTLGPNEWINLRRAQEHCYLLTNGLGGYSSLSAACSNARNDQALFMAAVKAPTERMHIVTNICEALSVRGGQEISLYSQEFSGDGEKESCGYHMLTSCSADEFPTYTYQAAGMEIVKTIVMTHGENTVGVQYEIFNPGKREGSFRLRPLLQFMPKGARMPEGMELAVSRILSSGEICITGNEVSVYLQTNGKVETYPVEYMDHLYYERDERDGRDYLGRAASNHDIIFNIKEEKEEFYIIYSMDQKCRDIRSMMEAERQRLAGLVKRAGLTDDTARRLVKSADQFLVERESTGGKSIIAGYPFFGDWGRDTMIAMAGCTLSAGRLEEAKSILKTFMAYCQKGLMPNLFPEGGVEPMYNTADASLLFIGMVYLYYQRTNDLDFLEEAYPVMESIAGWYQEGTDFHIRMDDDGLIMAGSGLEQVTWMDIRFEDILPTPRHGKPVEINAYWYNALKVLETCGGLLRLEPQVKPSAYGVMAELVKESFLKKFWNEEKGCLRDVISSECPQSKDSTRCDNQVRCNQVWALSQSFCMVDGAMARLVLEKVFEDLYTPYGLRSLSPEDEDFQPVYGGPHFHRDMAYHQGTVWAFPLGAYYLAYLRWTEDKEMAVRTVRRQLKALEACMGEGCIGQIAEVYDGLHPSISQGCFAQAWSVGELLRVYEQLEYMEAE